MKGRWYPRIPNTLCTSFTVMFELNVLLDLSWRAATKTFSLLMMELALQVLGQSTGAMTIQVIRGDKGVGDIPGIRSVQGGL